MDFSAHGCVHGKIKDFMYAQHLFAAAFDVGGTHLSCDILALLLRDRSQALGLEEVYTGAFGAKVRFEADEHEGSRRTEMEDFGIPL